MGARLCTYLLIALTLHTVGRACGLGRMLESPLFGGFVYLLLGLMLVSYCAGLGRDGCNEGCSMQGQGGKTFGRFRLGARSYALRAGMMSASGLCAPMFAFAVESMRGDSPTGAALAVTGFFLGTNVALLPLFALGVAARSEAARDVGKLFCALAALVYLAQGANLVWKAL